MRWLPLLEIIFIMLCHARGNISQLNRFSCFTAYCMSWNWLIIYTYIFPAYKTLGLCDRKQILLCYIPHIVLYRHCYEHWCRFVYFCAYFSSVDKSWGVHINFENAISVSSVHKTGTKRRRILQVEQVRPHRWTASSECNQNTMEIFWNSISPASPVCLIMGHALSLWKGDDISVKCI